MASTVSNYLFAHVDILGYGLMYLGLVFGLYGLLYFEKRLFINSFYALALGVVLACVDHILDMDIEPCLIPVGILVFFSLASIVHLLGMRNSHALRNWWKSFLFAHVKFCIFLLVLAGGVKGYWEATKWLEMRKLQVGGVSENINIIVIGIDGGRPDVFVKAEAKNFLGLRKRAAWTFKGTTNMPSWTGPGFISIGTGLTPEHHGVKVNRFEHMTKADKALIVNRWKNGTIKTMVDYGKVSRGMKTVLVISATTDFQEELREFLGLRNLDDLRKVDGDVLAVTKEASSWFNEKQPLMLLMHIKEIDEAGHKFGWMSPKQYRAARLVDQSLGVLFDSLAKSPKRNNTYVIIVADHGGHTEYNPDGTFFKGSHGTNSAEDMTIPWFVVGPRVRRGYEIKSKVNVCDTTATILYILGIPIPEEMDGKPVIEAFRQ